MGGEPEILAGPTQDGRGGRLGGHPTQRFGWSHTGSLARCTVGRRRRSSRKPGPGRPRTAGTRAGTQTVGAPPTRGDPAGRRRPGPGGHARQAPGTQCVGAPPTHYAAAANGKSADRRVICCARMRRCCAHIKASGKTATIDIVVGMQWPGRKNRRHSEANGSNGKTQRGTTTIRIVAGV